MVNITLAQNNQNLTEYIESQKEDIETAIKLSMMRLEVKPIKVEGFDPYDDYNFQDISAVEDEDSLKNLIEELTDLYVHLRHPYNLVEFGFEKNEYAKLQGESHSYFREHPEELPIYEPIEIRFKDGKTQKVKKYISQRALKASQKDNSIKAGTEFDDLENYFLEQSMYSSIDQMGFYTSKPIDRITVKATLNTPDFTTYRLTKNGETVETPEGKIELVGISGNQLEIKISATLEDRYKILPMYEDGRVLREQSSNKNSGYGEQAVPKLQKVIGFYDQALSEVKNGNINSTDEVDTFVKTLTTKNKLKITEEDQVIEIRQALRGPISEIIVKIKKEKPKKQTFTFEMAWDTNEETQDSMEKLFIVSDFKTEKYGLLDIKGNWVVRPEYNELYTSVDSHFYYEWTEDDERNYYFFDSKKKQFQSIDFIPISDEPLAERYFIIHREKGGAQGVFDLKTQKTIIPITNYQFEKLVGDKYWLVRKINEKYTNFNRGVLDENGDIIIPPIQMRINYQDGFFYVENYMKEEDYPEVYQSNPIQPDIYNHKGINITQGKYNTIEGKFVEGAQLVKNERYKRSGKSAITLIATDIDFIDVDGNVLAEFPNDEYKEVHPFENGLSRIQNAVGFYGFVDTAGQIALPFEYVFATDFKGSYALAQFNQDGQSVTAFIDKKGKVIKRVPASFRDVRYKDDKPYVILENGDTYDFEANPF